MANLKVKDGDGSTKYIAKEGAGTDVDPYVEPNADAVLGTTQDIANATQATAVIVEAQAAAIGEGDDAEATGDGTLIAIVKRIRTLLAGTLTVQGTVTTTLPAGDNNIGNVDIVTMPNVTVGTLPAIPAGTNNIGDVDVLTLPALAAGSNAIGSVGIVEKVITTVAGTASTSGDNTLVAAPGSGVKLVIVAFTIQNESTTATTILLKSGSTTKRRALLQSQGDGYGVVFPAGREWKLGTNEALVLNLSGANSHNYTVDHYSE
jgi:hypothetical protein